MVSAIYFYENKLVKFTSIKPDSSRAESSGSVFCNNLYIEVESSLRLLGTVVQALADQNMA